MLEFRQRPVRSWLDESYGRSLAHELSERLVNRCAGEKALVITLTYNREGYADARELFRAQQDEQHVPLFFRRLARALGENLAGRWFAKVEFQRGGWIHFHCVIVGLSWIDHEVLTETWGHGHTWVKPASRSKLAYACKYVAKEGGVPQWLLNERRVRIVRVSPGFWLSETRHRERKEPGIRYTFAYIPIGERLQRARSICIVREETIVSSDKPGVAYTGRVVRWRQFHMGVG